VTASVQLVGDYRVFAALINPALATRSIENRWPRVSCGYGVGLVSAAAGLLVTVNKDLPAGAIVVSCVALTAILFAWLVQPKLGRPGSQDR